MIDGGEELKEAIQEVKDPERRINLWTAFIIISALAIVVIFLFRSNDSGKDIRISNLERNNAALQHGKDSLINIIIQNAWDQVKEAENVHEFKMSYDSLHFELDKIKQNLTSK